MFKISFFSQIFLEYDDKGRVNGQKQAMEREIWGKTKNQLNEEEHKSSLCIELASEIVDVIARISSKSLELGEVAGKVSQAIESAA